MTTRRKAFVVVVAATTALVAALLFISQSILFRGFAAVEHDSTVQNVRRATDAFSAQLSYLDSKSGDWANWDDTYAFMEDGNSEYIASNLTDQAFRDLALNIILFVSPSGQLQTGKAYDLERDFEAQVPASLMQLLTPPSPLLQPEQNEGNGKGVVLLPEGELMVVSRPIRTSNGTGPSRGTLIMGRFIDNAMLDQLAQTTHLTLDLVRWGTEGLPQDWALARNSLSDPSQTFVQPVNDQTIAGYALLDDINGNPALLLQVTTPRPIYQQGQATIMYIFWALVAIALPFGLACQILIDRLVRAWQALQESQARYIRAERGANDGLWDWDLRTQTVYYSPHWKEMLGFENQQIRTSPEEWLGRIHPDDETRVRAEIAAHLEGQSSYLRSEHRVRHRTGRYLWVLCRGSAERGKHGKPSLMAGSMSDISDRKRAEEQLLRGAFYDAVTGLPNRALFHDRLQQAIERAKRAQRPGYAVLFMDLDRFKAVNDNWGHSIGDQLLVVNAYRLKLCARSVDTVARLGGDEFVVLLDDIHDLAEATQVAERLLKEVALPFDLEGKQVLITTSVGIVLGSVDYERADQVLRDAEIALHRAKSSGRARSEVFDSAMTVRAQAQLDSEAELSSAIERQEFEVYYQPIVRLADHQWIGLEALMRWRHPERGIIQAADFIAAAEETGLIVPIGDWVLKQACAQMHQWQIDHPVNPALFVSVNLSARQFAQAGLPGRVADLLKETGLPAHSLRLEITESVLMKDADQAAAVLKQLRSMGIQVHIDDFGTADLPLGYLQQFPISMLKIDRSLITRMGEHGDDNAAETRIVKDILKQAQSLGLTVIAEGIETPEQLRDLQGLECGYGQGYYLFKPMVRREIDALLLKKSQAETEKQAVS